MDEKITRQSFWIKSPPRFFFQRRSIPGNKNIKSKGNERSGRKKAPRRNNKGRSLGIMDYHFIPIVMGF